MTLNRWNEWPYRGKWGNFRRQILKGKEENKMENVKITYEAYKEKHTIELSPGASLPRMIHIMMNLLVAGGYSREGIAELLKNNDESIWDWDV